MSPQLLLKGFEVEMYTGRPDGTVVGCAAAAARELAGFVTEPDQRNLEYTTPPHASYQQQLGRLEERMDALLARYTRQFSLMESIVGESNSLRTGLQGTFEGLAEMYKRR